jgi:tripartite-type tricarboxylate transporter receptor subunit TctC
MRRPQPVRRSLVRAPATACVVAVAALAAGAFAPAALAQQWPAKPVRLLLGFTPGGAADGVARAFSQRFEQLIGQQVIIDYRPGAGATLGAEQASKAPPDGYTLHLVDSGPMAVAPHLRKVGYDPLTSFTPIGGGAIGGVAFVVHPSVPASNLQEAIALLRSNPGKYSYGTSGVGGGGHLAGEQLRTLTKIEMTHVPYKGGGPAMAELLGNQIPMLFASMGTAVQPIRAGRIKAIGVTSLKRASALPDVPTFDEQGLKGFDAQTWFILVGPAGLPQDIVTRANQALNRALEEKAVGDNIRNQGYEVLVQTPAETAQFIRSEFAKWGKVVKDANIPPE